MMIVVLGSCGMQRYKVPRETTRALSRQLGFTVSRRDNVPLMQEVCSWLGTPYRLGGTTRDGVDCSAFAGAVYREVYHRPLQRTVALIYREDCRRIGKRKAREGDLVFFNFNRRPRGQLTHVGSFLKRGYFVHAGASRGVMVSHLSEAYYKKGWQRSGRVK